MNHLFTAMILAICVISFSACANNSETRSTTSASNATAGQRTYSSEDLNRTGKRTTSEQLQAADPSVTAQGSNQ